MPVDAHAALADPLLRLTPRGGAGRGDDLLDPNLGQDQSPPEGSSGSVGSPGSASAPASPSSSSSILFVLLVDFLVRVGILFAGFDPDGRRRGRGRRDLAGFDGGGEVGVEVFGLGKLRELVEAEPHQKVLRRPIEERRPDDRLLARGRDQLLLEERLQHARGVDAADVLDLRKRDRLAVGDDRQRLERRERQPGALGDLVKLSQQRVEFGPRDESPPARDLLQADASIFALGAGGQPLEGRGQGLRRRLQEVREVLLPHGLGRGEQDRLQRGKDPLDRGLARLRLGSGFVRGRDGLGHGFTPGKYP